MMIEVFKQRIDPGLQNKCRTPESKIHFNINSVSDPMSDHSQRLPSSLPSLPPLPDGVLSRSANVQRAYHHLIVSFARALDILSQESDPIRLNMQKEDMIEIDFALILALDDQKDQEHLSENWLLNIAHIF